MKTPWRIINEQNQANTETLKQDIAKISSELHALKKLIQKLPENSTDYTSHISSSAERVSSANYIYSKAYLKQGKTNVLVAGFFGAKNFGDELMLQSFLVHLHELDNLEISILASNNYQADTRNYSNSHIIHYPSTDMEIDTLADCFDALIFAGGSHIDDTSYGLDAVGVYNVNSLLINLTGRFIEYEKVTILYGLSSVTTLRNAKYIEGLSHVISNSSHFSVRDSLSLNTLKKAGIDIRRVGVVDDVVFSLFKNVHTPRRPPRSNRIGLIYVLNKDTFDSVFVFTKRLLAAFPEKVLFTIIPFYSYHNYDVTMAERLVELLDTNRVHVENDYPDSLEDFITRTKSASMIISMRYHGSLLSNALGAKTVILDMPNHLHYKNKNAYLVKNYSSPNLIITDISAPDMKKIVRLKSSRSRNINSVAVISKKSSESIENILKMIK